MAWVQLTVVVDATYVDYTSDMFEGLMAAAVTAENAGQDEFYEVAFPGKPAWQKVRLTALFDDQVDPHELSEFVLKRLHSEGAEEIPCQINQLADQDWQRVWLDSFKPINVGKELWVIPSWCTAPEPTAKNIMLDPGLAFGTGTHATTHLCLDWLSRQSLDEQRVLDYGSGSGILAIASIKLGAGYADAVDIDPLAVSASLENAARNQVETQFSAYLPEQLEAPAGAYDLVIANILADVIVSLKDTLLGHLNANGQIILTGILDSQVERVKTVYREIDFSVEHKEHWSMLVGRPRPGLFKP